MKSITKKIGALVIAICFALFCGSALFATQMSQPTVAQSEAISKTNLADYNSAAPLETIETIEEELHEQGTSILAVLQAKRSSYIDKNNSALGNEKEAITSIIATLSEAIAGFGGDAFSLIRTSNFYAIKATEVSANSNGLSTNCTCSTSLVIPCANCDLYMNTSLAVAAIAAGFEARGWGLAADLMLFNKSNKTLDVDYWPCLGNNIIAAPQIVEVAQNNSLADSSDQKSPGRLNGLFESTIEGDMYNSLGSFYFTKKNAGNGNVELDIIDRYDWARGANSSGGIFNNTLALAQEIGVVTPFYTRIKFTMPGYVPYNWEYTDDGVEIRGVANDITTAKIPATILDMRIKPKDGDAQPKAYITSISDNAFSNNTYLEEVIFLNDTETNDPSKLTIIGKSAFSGCSNLASMSGLSNVTYVGDNAFYNCKELQSVTLSSVNYLGKNAFAECTKLEEVLLGANTALEIISEKAFYNTNLSDFKIPTNVVNIEDKAFLGTTITSFEGNINYIWEDNVLIKCNVTDTSKQIAVYVNPTVSNISFPSNVSILSSSLFENNGNINTVYLNQVEHIGPEAFRNSSVTNLENADNIIDCDKTALYNTPWYNNKGNSIVLGNVLIEYRGNESVIIIPDNVYRIGADCFSNNITTQVVLSAHIDSIGYAAFSGLTALESVIFTSDFPPLLDGDCFSENVILFVKESRLAEYKNNISFLIIPNTITTKKIQISFYDVDNNYIGNSEEYYGSKFDNYISAPIIKGQDFCGWDYNGYKLNINDMIVHYNDLELTAEYETAEYQITIFDEYGEQSMTIKYGQIISFPIPDIEGKVFKGWYDDIEGGEQIVDAAGECVWKRTIENDTLYPQFDLIKYIIYYFDDGADMLFDMPNEFTIDSPVTKEELLSPQKFGYVFKKWTGINQEFTSTSGIFEDIILIAVWEGETINVAENLSVTDSVAVVKMTRPWLFPLSKTYNITIESSVKSITFVGGTSAYDIVKITIAKRSTALMIGFKNVNFKAPGGYDAIGCISDVMIYVTYLGENTIRGGTGANATGDGANGGVGRNGIYAGSVTLMAFDSSSKISIYGGNGGNGSNGYKGNNGKDGTIAPSGSIFAPVKGEDGADGSGGHKGGNGGDGGCAIYSRSKQVFVTHGSDYFIRGGNGGKGGNGGAGGAGGKGADDISANPFTGVGKPGDGGNGGNGGANGAAGQGAFGINYEILETESGSIGADGSSGSGGAAGKGGFHGTVGEDGENGADGKSGSDGDFTLSDMNDGLAEGQSQSDSALEELPYAFSAEFFNEYLR